MNKAIISIIIVVLVLAGIYYFLVRQGEEVPPVDEVGAIEALSESDAVPVLEEELQTTDLGNLDQEFSDINAELDRALSE